MNRRLQSGFSLVELLVAVVIGLIGSIIMFQTYSVFESQKRSTTSGGDASTNLVIAASLIEQNAKQAGYGMNLATHLGCTMFMWYQPTNPPTIPTGVEKAYKMVPVDINSSGTEFTFYRSGNDRGYATTSVQVDMTSPTSNITPVNMYGFSHGDVIVLAERKDLPSSQAITCAAFEITDMLLPASNPSGNTIPDRLVTAYGEYTKPSTGSVKYYTRYNKENGLGTWPQPSTLTGVVPAITSPATQFTFTRNAAIMNLGPARPIESFFGKTTFSLSSDGQLLSNGTPVADGIVFMRAQYGKAAADAKGSAVTYTQTMPDPATNQAEWFKLRSVRVALIARVGQYEKDLVSPATISVWGGSVTFTVPDQHYRYRLLELEIPLRNFFWRP